MINEKHSLMFVLSMLMKECDIDDTQLSKETGVPASTISRLKINENTNPTTSTLRPIANFFSISVSQLLGDEPLPPNRIEGTHLPSYYTNSRMPVLTWNMAFSWAVKKQGFPKKPDHWISTEKSVSEKAFALIIPNDSFGLIFRENSIIIIEPDKEPNDGDFIALQDKQEKSIILKKLIIEDDDYYLASVRPEIKKIIPLNSDYKLLGVIIETRFSNSRTNVAKDRSEKSYVLNLREKLLKSSLIFNSSKR